MCDAIESLLIESLLVVLTWVTATLGVDDGAVERLESSPIPARIETDAAENDGAPPDEEAQEQFRALLEVVNDAVEFMLAACGFESTSVEEFINAAPVMATEVEDECELQPAGVADNQFQWLNEGVWMLLEQFNTEPLDRDELRKVRRMLRPVMATELERVRQTCDLSVDQRPQIRNAAESGSRQAARKCVESGQYLVSEGIVFELDASSVIRKNLVKVMRKTLTPEQVAQYLDDSAQFTDARHKIVAFNIVSRLDDELRLTAEQRESILQSVLAKLPDLGGGFEYMLAVGFGDNGTFPQAFDPLVRAHLNATQRRAWKAIKTNLAVETAFAISDFEVEPADQGVVDLDEEWWAGKVP